jgi:hypothetical protein
MKKKHMHHKKRAHHRNRRRNAGEGGASISGRSRSSRISRRSAAPPWKTIAAAVAGGAGGAALGGLLVNQKILSPEAVGVGLMLGGGAAAYFADGTARVVGTSVAAAGAGQLALATMAKQAFKGQSLASAPAVAQLPPPPPPVEPPRKSATGGGAVVDLFRDAASDLDMVEDQWRYGQRDQRDAGDEPRDAAEPLVIELEHGE